MSRILLTAALIASAAPALAQAELTPGPLAGSTSCAQFTAMDGPARLAALRAEPLGYVIEPDDRAAAEQWMNQVAAECAAHPEESLIAAATAALDTD